MTRAAQTDSSDAPAGARRSVCVRASLGMVGTRSEVACFLDRGRLSRRTLAGTLDEIIVFSRPFERRGLKRVSFRFPDNSPVLSGIALRVRRVPAYTESCHPVHGFFRLRSI